ncbi:MAG: low temperature requirement protein A [Mycobacteriales bacterium]
MTSEPHAEGSDTGAGLSEQRVTWAELFFDLVWVFGLTQVAATLAVSHGIGEAAQALLLLAPLWWGWVGVTLLGNTSGSSLDTPRGRLLLFGLAGCGLAMTVAIPHAYGRSGWVFASGYFVLRLLLWSAMRSRPLFGGLRLEPFAVGLLVAGPLFMAGGVLDGAWRWSLWAAAATIEMLSPTLLGHRLDRVRFETSHLPERFGLFIIIALGETVVAVGSQASARPLGAVTLTTTALSFAIILGLWWTYFHFGAAAVRHSLQVDPVQSRIVRQVFSFAHFLYVIAIICVAVGLKKLLAHPWEQPHGLPAFLLAPGVALYLFGFCYARWRMFGAAAVPRFAGAFACLAVAAAAPVLPGLAVAALVLVALVAVNALEAWWVGSGRPLMVLRLPRRVRRAT